jgi:uncharacterized protein YjbJ (UPF0337 family)
LTQIARRPYSARAKADEPFGVRRLWRFSWTFAGFVCAKSGYGLYSNLYVAGGDMGLLDKLLGRGKKAAGDLKGDDALRREGAAQERQAGAEEHASQLEDKAQEAREQAAQAHAEREDT